MSADSPTKVPVVLYQTVGGAEVVLDWIRGLDEATATRSART